MVQNCNSGLPEIASSGWSDAANIDTPHNKDKSHIWLFICHKLGRLHWSDGRPGSAVRHTALAGYGNSLYRVARLKIRAVRLDAR